MLTTFCCCYHLRTSTIVLAWLQVMGYSFVIFGFLSPLHIFQFENYDIYIFKTYAVLQPISYIIFADSLLKIVSCFALIWGVVQRQHFFMQPWLFLQFVENIFASLGIIGVIVWGVYDPLVFAFLAPVALITGLGWYIWFCVRAVYKEDYVESTIFWKDDVETMSTQAQMQQNFPRVGSMKAMQLKPYRNSYSNRQY